MHEIWFNSTPVPPFDYVYGAYVTDDVTELAGAPNAAGGSPLDAYFTSFNNQQHVDYIGNDGHIHELWYDTAWHHNDLTLATGVTGAPVSQLLGWADRISDGF
ncbi:MAG: hypothetical protein WAM39_00935 [Bryobacteraceae bacterium]